MLKTTWIICCFVAVMGHARAADLTIRVTNEAAVARPRATIELSKEQLAPVAADLRTVHVFDQSGEVLAQAAMAKYNEAHEPDILLFQAAFKAGETKSFVLKTGKKQAYTKDQFKTFGRFVRERFDDFAWENDLIAHRMYGKALETWVGEPLTSSTVDIWSKRTSKMVVNDWYMVDDYHADHGDGADFYSAGPSRGCGGSGIWQAGKLWVSKNFVQSRVLANGPIRVTFELDYEPFDANGRMIRETKQITLDAGSQLDRFISTYSWEGPGDKSVPPVVGIGLKKTSGSEKTLDKNILCVWEKVAKNGGMQGLAVIVDPKALKEQNQDKLNDLLLAQTGTDMKVTYWAGFCWDKAGAITDLPAWKKYLSDFAQALEKPLRIQIANQ